MTFIGRPLLMTAALGLCSAFLTAGASQAAPEKPVSVISDLVLETKLPPGFAFHRYSFKTPNVHEVQFVPSSLFTIAKNLLRDW